MATKFSGLHFCTLTGVNVTTRVLGHGSYATVLELEYMGYKCAGKKIHDVLLMQGTTTYPVLKFEKECLLLSQLQHPNIVEFLGVFFQNDSQAPILVMEYLPTDLTSCIKKRGVFPEEVSCSILCDVAQGLNYLHNQYPPIIHRDLTSNNVLLTSNMTAKISDLGVARIVDKSPLQVSYIMTQTPGTPAYMPPEVMIANPIYDASIDEFSYGILMIHVLSGQWPEPQVEPNRIEGDKLVPVSEAERRKKFIDTIGDDHPLMEFILRCINNNPQLRPHSGEIVDKLSELVQQFPARQSEKFILTGTMAKSIAAQKEGNRMEESETESGTLRRSKAKKVVSADKPSFDRNDSQEEGKMSLEKPLKGLFGRKQKKKPSEKDQSVSVIIPDKRALPVCVAKYGYNREEAKELSFKKGELLYIISDKDKWWFAQSKETEREGYIPSNYVIKLPRGEEIDQNEVQLMDKVGEGRFSYIWKGIMYGVLPVTIKISRPMCAHQSHEAAVLLMLSHPNIVQLYGICSARVPLCTVVEFMKHGSLYEYLRNEGRTLELPHLINLASQVASGMAHLEERNYVHRDLATKNVLVGEKLTCKVANFDYAQVVHEGSSMVAVDLSIKWTAPESILYDTFTIKSDVWSFGVLLYEIITYSRSPYPGLTNSQVVELVQQGYRMPRPINCPEKLYDIILDCWKDKPECRPTFETLKWQLEDYFMS